MWSILVDALFNGDPGRASPGSAQSELFVFLALIVGLIMYAPLIFRIGELERYFCAAMIVARWLTLFFSPQLPMICPA